MDDNRM